MKRFSHDKLYPFELALLLALCVTLLTGARAGAQQQELAEKVVRLHVIAESDSQEDQTVKLQVRDAVLARVEAVLESAGDAEEAADLLREMLPDLEETARRASGEEKVSVTLGRESYPTRRYEDFALPAGEYTSLRVSLGEAQGRNWWCVVYPPLCTGSVTEAASETAALDDEDVRLITEDGTEYVLRFRLMELWGQIFNKMGTE